MELSDSAIGIITIVLLVIAGIFFLWGLVAAFGNSGVGANQTGAALSAYWSLAGIAAIGGLLLNTYKEIRSDPPDCQAYVEFIAGTVSDFPEADFSALAGAIDLPGETECGDVNSIVDALRG